MESEDQPIARDIYHFLTWCTNTMDEKEAILRMKEKLLSRGFSQQFIDTMDFTTTMIGSIYVGAGYWA